MERAAFLNSLDEKEIEKNLYKEKEFTYIFETYYKRVYNYMYYRVKDYHIAEDLTSQVFEKIMVKIDTYSKTKSPFEVWMFAIARNVVRDYLRSKKNKLFSIDRIKELISREKTPEGVIEISEIKNRISRALNVLNTRERNIIALRFGAELKNKEIAEILDISESNVGVILYRSMKKLKKEIERGGQL